MVTENSDVSSMDMNVLKTNIKKLDEDLRKDLYLFIIISTRLVLSLKKKYSGVEVKLRFTDNEELLTKITAIEEDSIVTSDGIGHIGLHPFGVLKRISILNENLLRGESL